MNELNESVGVVETVLRRGKKGHHSWSRNFTFLRLQRKNFRAKGRPKQGGSFISVCHDYCYLDSKRGANCGFMVNSKSRGAVGSPLTMIDCASTTMCSLGAICLSMLVGVEPRHCDEGE